MFQILNLLMYDDEENTSSTIWLTNQFLKLNTTKKQWHVYFKKFIKI